MSQTQINGGTQIKTGTIPLSALVSGYSIPTSNLTDGSLFIKSDGSVNMAASLNMNSHSITNVTSPTNAGDAATKSYVDARVGGVGGIHQVRVVATSNLSLSTLQTVDGVTLVANDLILLTAQSTGSQNGPWVAASGSWTRPTWWAGASSQNENQYFLIGPDGTTYKDTKWWCTTTGTITVDTTSIAFVQDASGTTYTNGTGLNLAGNTFSVIYGTTGTTAAVGNDSRITGALQTSSLGANVATALAVAVGSAGSFVTNGGALGTPSSGTLTSCSGLPISGIASLGTGVATALAAATNAGSGLLTLSSGYVAAAQMPAFTGGDVTSSAGSLTLSVNHTAGSGFMKYTDFVVNETPTGTVNGVNATFTLANTPATVNGSASSLELTLNGVALEPGAGNDFTLSGSTITMLLVPQTGDKLRAYYVK